MFLEERIIKEKDGPAHLVHYCRNCKSKEIETIQTCKKCGSHDIANPIDFYDLKSKGYDDTYGTIQNYKERKVKIYKCDLCGKEFDGLKTDNYLSYYGGEFERCNYKCFSGSEELDYINYQLPMDLCEECKSKLQTHLAIKLIDFTRDKNIQKIIKEYIDKKVIEKERGEEERYE